MWAIWRHSRVADPLLDFVVLHFNGYANKFTSCYVQSSSQVEASNNIKGIRIMKLKIRSKVKSDIYKWSTVQS